jgi:hypothetical protein
MSVIDDPTEARDYLLRVGAVQSDTPAEGVSDHHDE